ncbi:GDSL-type esterase/lipase family protein [Pontiellaceae bacterium B12219]|nr:GDSL-type esterase/lipase family protein [Pontiellaceae bacterium B12219]
MLLGCASAFGFDASWIVVDSDAGDASVVMEGSWTYRAIGQGNNSTYDHDGNTLKGSKSVQLIPNLPVNSTYNVYLNWVSNNNRASNVPVTITCDGGSSTVIVNQRNPGDWVLLGSYPFLAGTGGGLLIETTGTDGYVIADAAAWEAVEESYDPSEINVVATIPETTDGDMRNNLAEFFDDTNPTAIDAAPGMEIAHDGTNILISASRNPAASLLDVQLETATMLNDWQPAASALDVAAGSNGANDLLLFEVPVNNDGHQFWRTAVSQPDSLQRAKGGIAFWSFDTQFDGTGEAATGITYLTGFKSPPVISQSGSATASVVYGGADAFFGPDSNTWSGTGHSLSWSAGSTGNVFSVELNTLQKKEISVRFDVRSSLPRFSARTYDTGMGPLVVPDADLMLTDDGTFKEWTIDLSLLDAVNSRSNVVLTWSFDDLAGDGFFQIDNVVISGAGRAKSQLVRNLEAGRLLQHVVVLGTSLTENGAYVGLLSDALNSSYDGLANVFNSGKAGKNSDYGVANFNSLVIEKEPDTLFIEYGINDSVERFDLSVADAWTNLTYIVDGTLASFPDCEIILMTMTPGDKYDSGHTSYRKDIQDYYAMYRTFARERGYLVIDHYSSWTALQTNDVALFNSYVPDTIHPGAPGNEAVVLPVLMDVLGISETK